MLRQAFESELRRLRDEILTLGSMVEEALFRAVDCLKRRDLQGSRRVIAADGAINEKRFAIEYNTLAIIATQQPTAGDLRRLAAILEVATELERTGDYAKGISKISLSIGDDPLIKPVVDLPLMCEKACDMLSRALAAFVSDDLEVARSLPDEDDVVDALYNQVYRELLALMLGNPATFDQCTLLLWAAHNLERAADRVTNICERTVFTVTGELVEMGVE